MKALKTSKAFIVHSFAELKLVKKEIATRTEQQRQAAAQAQKVQAQRNLFRAAVGNVQRLPQSDTVLFRPQPPAPLPLQSWADETAAWREAMSDEVDISTLLHTDERLSYTRSGVGLDVVQNLRRGKWAIQRQIDLHGLRLEEARQALGQFLRESHAHGIRCVRVVTGKGLGSLGKTGVLKDKVPRWLVQRNEVLAFAQAQPAHGGAGALLVLLA